MKGDKTKKVFIWLVIYALVIQLVPVIITGDTWVQTTQEDFEEGETWNTNVTLSPGEVTLDPSPTDWIKGQGNPIIDLGPTGSFDDFEVGSPSVLYENGTFKMWYTGIEGSPYNDKIGYATSSDGFAWNKYPENPVLRPSPPEKWDDTVVRYPYVIFNGVEYLMYYGALTSSASPHHWRIGVANSSDGINWEKYPLNPVIDLGAPGSWDDESIHSCSVVYNEGLYQMWYSGSPSGGIDNGEIGYATSTDGYNWTKYPGNPVFLKGGGGTWDSLLVADPMVRYDNGVYHLWYSGRDTVGNNAFGYATSNDGINWIKFPNNPILTPGSVGSWDSTIIWWPYVLKIDNTYRMWYRGDEGTHTRIGHAFSMDGINWTKIAGNPVLDIGKPGEWDDTIVENPRLMYDGTIYRMWYVGNEDPGRIGYAESVDGVIWTRVTNTPVIDIGSPGEWDAGWLNTGAIIKEGTVYKMWYGGEEAPAGQWKIGYATSSDGINWTKYSENPVMSYSQTWEVEDICPATVIKESGIYKMWYYAPSADGIGYATSTDGINWTKYASNPVLIRGSLGNWDNELVSYPYVIKDNGIYKMWYTGSDTSKYRIGYAESLDGINWTKSLSNPVLDVGSSGEWDSNHILFPSIIEDGYQLKMWYSGWDGSTQRIGYAKAAYGTRFIKEPSNPVLDIGPVGSWDDYGVNEPSILYENGIYKIWYTGVEGAPYNGKIGYATSSDGMEWNKYYQNPILTPNPPEVWDDVTIGYPNVIFNGHEYIMYYSALTDSASPNQWRIGAANSSDGIYWIKYPLNPIINLGPSSWDGVSVPGCSVVYHDGLYQMWYTGSPSGGMDDAEIGYATSIDGYNWVKDPVNPVFYKGAGGTWDSSSVAFPSVVYDGLEYHLWYTGKDAGGNFAIGYANSYDGINWTKYSNNPILTPGTSGSWDDLLISAPRIIKINDTFRMWYWGSDGSNTRIGHAISYDGINWTKRAVNPVMDVGKSGEWDDYTVRDHTIIKDGQTYKMWYQGVSTADKWHWEIGYAESSDCISWSKHPDSVFSANSSSYWESGGVMMPSIIKRGSTYKMWYAGENTPTGNNIKIGYTESPDGINWSRVVTDPVLDSGNPSEWDYPSVWDPFVMYDKGIYRMWYTAGSNAPWDSIGYAESTDGINWIKYPGNPVLEPGSTGSWDDHGIGQPHVEKINGIYIMWYSGVDEAIASDIFRGIGTALSLDGINWTKSYLNPVLIQDSPITWDRKGVYSPTLLQDFGVIKMWFTGHESSGWKDKIGLATCNNISIGTFESSVFDSGYFGTFWNSISWNETLPPNTMITLSVRTGDTPTPDSTWTNWSEEIYNSLGSIITQPQNRYIQYRATLISLDAKDTPILEDITINYGLNTATPPILYSPPSDLWTSNNIPAFSWLYNDSEGDSQGGYLIEIDDDLLFRDIDYTSGEVLTPGEEWIPSLTISDDTWYWHVRTMDKWGLWSDWSEVWSINIDTTPPDPPIDPTPTPDGWSNVNSFTIDWTNPTDFSGIKEGCWYKIGSPPTSNSDGTYIEDKPFTISSLEGEQTIYIWLEDNLGNVNYLNYSSVTLYLDTIPPSILHTLPTSGVLGQPITINATITDNVLVKSATLYYRKTGDTNWSSVSMIKDGDSFTAEIPASVVTMTGIQYYLEASDEINTVKYPSFVSPNNYFNLTIVDTVPPTISHTPITNGTENQTITISATITDNVGVTGAILYYRIKGTTLWSSTPMKQNINVFSADIPNSDVTPKGIEYYIFATDSIFNITHPEENPQTDPHEITVTAIEIPDDGEPEPKEEMDFLTSWWWLLLLIFIVIAILVFLLARRREEEEAGVGPIAEEEPVAEEISEEEELKPEEPMEIITEEEPQPKPPEEPQLPDEESEIQKEGEMGAEKPPKTEMIPPLPSQEMSDDEIFEIIKKKFEEGKISEKTFEDFKKRYIK